MTGCPTAGTPEQDGSTASATLLRRGRQLEAATLGWNVAGVAVLAVAVARAHSVALAGFGLDSLLEIGASAVVLWELAGTHAERRRRGLSMIRTGFVVLALYLTSQTAVSLIEGAHPATSALGMSWTAATAVVMGALAAGKRDVGTHLSNAVLLAEGRVTAIDAVLAGAVLLGLGIHAAVGVWWTDPAAALLIVGYALRESIAIHHDLNA